MKITTAVDITVNTKSIADTLLLQSDEEHRPTALSFIGNDAKRDYLLEIFNKMKENVGSID